MAWPARQQDENAVPGCTENGRSRSGGHRLSDRLQRRSEITRQTGCRNLEEDSSVDNGFHMFLIIEKKIDLVKENPLKVFRRHAISLLLKRWCIESDFLIRWRP